ncbi:MAG TPA: HoxN/HupN/NixA family nickel/cobalt transporter [Candidatus Dormibacteraeota bacterium]|jgi:high-affinity nickel-transport protein|nr:HoxN/HupN/NixA family nickel/cobalt transporter [Candidatus Dormibacteraeota bacterium]
MRRAALLYAFLIAFNLGVWGLALLASARYPIILGIAAIAYGFGLRHAVDPDHIAAIDNTTRKLMQDGQRPVATGFFFSLGHSTIVILLSVSLALATSFVKRNLPQLRATGSVIGTAVSALFLIVIGIINLIVLIELFKQFRAVRRGETPDQGGDHLAGGGLLTRLFRPALRLVDRSWKMYPVGVLFGLGFDTASEVGLLAITAGFGASGRIPALYIVLFPLLFTAGMSLVDATDGVLMLGAYGWAFVKPVRRLWYNLNITAISVLVALVIGLLEALQVIGAQTGGITPSGDGSVGHGPFWSLVNDLDISRMGLVIIAIFGLSWVGSSAYYRLRGLDRLGDADGTASAAGATR